ncbi:MAG: 5-formyltetrahydrofolate cyclo-ligase, partial [Bacteroidetes bacterium]|nr:5-formyltetrahydrofolate cyclo-ligase [Bacteroidota bacterium]
VPVFWLADEDHDLAEVLEGHAWGASLDEVNALSMEWPAMSQEQIIASSTMVGSLALPASLRQTTEAWHMADSVRDTLSRAYTEGGSLRDGMARWLSELFGHHGLVLFSRQHDAFHQASASLLSRAVSEAESIGQALSQSTEAVLASGGHQQASIDGTVLFHVNNTGQRVKWTQDQGQWRHAAMPKGESKDALLLAEYVRQHPEEVSPNVFMRLVLQSALLPVVGAALGPAELAYAGQSTKMFEWAGLCQPVWMPRYSLTLLDGGKQPWLDELGLQWTAFQQPLHELQTTWVDSLHPNELESALSQWETLLEGQAGELAEQVKGLDATLEASVDASRARMVKELDRVRTKIRRAIRRRESVQMSRMERLATRLMPAGALQERTIATWSVLSHFGEHVFDQLMDSLEGQEPDGHFLIQFEGVSPLDNGRPHEGKDVIRRKALKERKAMDSEDYATYSKKLSNGLIKLLEKTKPARIATFLPKIDAHEPDIRPAIEAAWALGVEVMVPKWSPQSPEMTFLPISSWEDVAQDDQGYLQPHGHGENEYEEPDGGVHDELEVQIPDVLWIPAVALDTQGGRIGYGKGYFDRAIHAIHAIDSKDPKASKSVNNAASAFPQRWAVCFSSWVYTDPIPQEAHDQAVHRIITENGILEV